jgi:hypothetical protein
MPQNEEGNWVNFRTANRPSSEHRVTSQNP